uniref:Novel immune-type receptor 13 n=1 Tax=Dicentrarchus labrax TaxID=13489 RepID=D2WL98_DICLA|nr:novel immune-type receptor 13 [Dicentrarchus labrax]
MMNFTFLATLLCTFSWFSVSVSEFHTVEVQPGEEVTLLCSNFSSLHVHISWFKLANGPNVSRISSMLNSDANVTFFDGFQNGKFNMTSNTTTLFLKIKPVDLSDSGLYFCGLYLNENSVIFSATSLKVQDLFDGTISLMSVILGALIVVLIIVVIGLVVKIKKLQSAHKEEPNPQHSENLGSDHLNYAALSFHPKARRSRSSPSENQLEPNAVYAATR